jgi:gliding motility-associated protein GldM
MKSSEAAVLNFLSDQVGKQTFKVDAFIPIASAKKAYVISGEPFEAEVTVGASSKSVYENMSIRVNGSPQKVENGVAKYTASTGSTGVQKYKVDITLTNPTTQKAETYSKEFEYEVGRRSVTVSADKMNVFYIGVDNPVSIAAAGVSSNELRVSANGAGISLRGGNGKYTATVSQPGEATINVSGGGLTNSRFMFRAKRIPEPANSKHRVVLGHSSTTSTLKQFA